VTRPLLIAVVVVLLAGFLWYLSKGTGEGAGRSSGDGWSAGSAVKMNGRLTAFMDELAAAVPFDLYVTDGERTATEQADRIMQKVDLGESWSDLLALYRRDDLIEQLQGADPNSWVEVIQAQVDAGEFMSSHLTGQALDLRTTGGGTGAPGQLSDDQTAELEDAVAALGARSVNEATPPHLHVNISGWTA
jgi:hypothetical protein